MTTTSSLPAPAPDFLARETLRLLGPAPDNWVPDHAGIDHNVAIVGGGYLMDPSARPELADIAPHILRWRDRYQPPADARDDELAASPYLGSGLEYLEKTAGATPWLRDIHVHNPAGFASVGLPLGDVPSMRRDIPRSVARISRDLLLADLALHEQRMRGDTCRRILGRSFMRVRSGSLQMRRSWRLDATGSAANLVPTSNLHAHAAYSTQHSPR